MAKRPYNPLAQPSERTIAAINDYLSGDGQQYHPGVSSLTRQPFVNYSQAEINVLRDTSWMSQSPGGGGAKSTYAEFGKGMRGAGFMDKGGNLTSDGMEAYRKAGLDPSSLKFEGSNFSSKNFARDAAKEAKASSSSKTEVTMKLDSKSQQTMEKFASGFETGAKIFERRTSGSMGMGSSADIRGESYSAHRKSLGGTQEATPLNQLPTHGASLGGGPTGGGGGRKPPINLTGATQEHLSFAKKPNSSLSSGFNRFQEQAVVTMKQPPYGWFETQGHSSHRTESGRRVAEYQKALAESKNVISSVAPRTTVTSAAVPATRVSVDPSTIPISSTDHRRSVSAIATARYRDQLAGSKTVSTVAAVHPFVPKVQIIPAATPGTRISVDPQTVEASTTGHRRDDTAIARARMQEAERMQELRYQKGQGRVGSGATVESSVSHKSSISSPVSSTPLSMPVDDGSVYTTNRPTTRGYDGSRQSRVDIRNEQPNPTGGGRYNRPFLPGGSRLSNYYQNNIAPNFQGMGERVVHHAGSALIWGGTGAAIGASVGLAKSAAGAYSAGLDESMQKLIGVGFTEPMRAYARQRILHTAATNPHVDPAKMATSLYELSSGITPTVKSLPGLMDQAERFQTYALTYTQDPARTSLEIGKMSNMLKNHPSYKGLTKEQAYERTFFHIAPLVETELFHGKDLMTAAQYFMNPAMNMMGWTPGQAFAMSGILQSSGIAPSTSGTALRQAIDENIYKGQARTQFLAEQVNAHAAAGKGHPLLASGAQDKFFTSKKMGGEWGLVRDPGTGALISPRQRLDQIRRDLMKDTSADAFLSNLERQRRQTEVLGGPAYGYSPQQMGVSATLIPTLYSMTPERVAEIKKAGQTADNVTLSEEEQKRRIEQRKGSEAPGSVYSKLEQAFSGWLNSPGGQLSGAMKFATATADAWAIENATLDHYSRSVNSKDEKTRKEHAFFYQDSITQEANRYVRENNPSATGAEKDKLVADRKDYLNRYYSMRGDYNNSTAGSLINYIPFSGLAIDAGVALSAKTQQKTSRWFAQDNKTVTESTQDRFLGNYSNYISNYSKYSGSGLSPQVSNLNTLSQMVSSTLPLAGFQSKQDNITAGYPTTPNVNISIGNKEVKDFSKEASFEVSVNRDAEEKATQNSDSISSVPVHTPYSELPTIGGPNL